MEAKNAQSVNSKGQSPYLVISTVILIVVAIITWFIYYLNSSLVKQIEQWQNLISSYASQIENINKSPEIAAYDIVKNSSEQIKKEITDSQASIYVREMIKLWKTSKIVFSWFSFDWEKISTEAKAISRDDKTKAISIVSSFIKEFRTTKNAMFILDPITAISWDAVSRSFSATLKIIK